MKVFYSRSDGKHILAADTHHRLRFVLNDRPEGFFQFFLKFIWGKSFFFGFYCSSVIRLSNPYPKTFHSNHLIMRMCVRLYSRGNLIFFFLNFNFFFLNCRCYNFDDLSDQPIIQEDQAIMSFTLDQVSN